MPYVLPTVEEFRTRFPIFEDEEDELIDSLIAEAGSQIDQSWREADYQPAILYLAAHLLASDNSAEGDSVDFGGTGGGAIVGESFGAMSVSYANKSSSAARAGAAYESYEATEYGRRFLKLLRQNKPAVLAI